jgi:hypothetical protein
MRFSQTSPRRQIEPGVAVRTWPDPAFSLSTSLRAQTAAYGGFALAEISKGIIILWIGDFATADAVGDLVGALAYPTVALCQAATT